MSRAIVVHAIAGILFVGVGTPDAQESIPEMVLRCDVLDGRVPSQWAGSLYGREMKPEADRCVTIRRGLAK